jgi:hypothetical protein
VTGVLDFLGSSPLALAALVFGAGCGAALRAATRRCTGRCAAAAAPTSPPRSPSPPGCWCLPSAALAPTAPALGALALARDLRARWSARPRRAPATRRRDLEARAQRRARAASRPAGPRPACCWCCSNCARRPPLGVRYARETTPRLRAFAAAPDVLVFPRAFTNATLSYVALASLVSARPAPPGGRVPRLRADLGPVATRGYQSCF